MEWSQEYNMFYTNLEGDIGRGIILYVHESLKAEEIKVDSRFCEHLFVKLRTSRNETMLIGVIYRSPSDSSEETGRTLRNLISEVSKLNFTHHLLMGDFNYPGINWDMMTSSNIHSEEQKFLECLQDNFLFQMVNKPTRWRGTNTPSVLDLIITKDPDTVVDMELQSPLGKSDHCVIIFSYVCRVDVKKTKKKRKSYSKADYVGLKDEIKQTNWRHILGDGSENINEIWTKFRGKMEDLENKFVPTYEIGRKKNQQIPLDKETLNVIKEKNALARKYLVHKDPDVRRNYNRTRNKAGKLVRKARKKYEKNLAKEAKSNSKRIWQYINSKSKSRQGIADLCTDPRDPKSEKTDDDETKANILAYFFSSVFTKEPDGEVPQLKARNIQIQWEQRYIKEETVKKILRELKVDKSPGLDNFHPRFLMELH
ncbi:uncharacterized protein LOC134245717 [Saccostrea cucullata]|uniref:uncharacterized protein LOC134241065 n=1 Tax=Saccostrea cuccullata TaxID=36930 RepID=UPI002ED39782